MTKYIELEALKNRFAKRLVWLKKDIHDEYSLGLYDGCEYDTKLIDEIPAADVAPVVHAQFTHIGPRFAGGVDWWNCSICGSLVSGVETKFSYCPHCGAKMDGGNVV